MVVRLSDFLNTSFSTFSANDTNNTGITYPGAVVHNTTLTPGVGIGAGLDYQVETTNNNIETGMRLETVTTDVTPGSEDFDFVVRLMQNGATASEKFRVSSTGNVTIGSGIIAGGSLGTQNQVLTSNGSSSFWALANVTNVSGVLSISNGGTNTTATPTQYGVAYGTGSAYAFTAQSSIGQFLYGIGNLGPPVWVTLDLDYMPDTWVKKTVRAATTTNITLSGNQTVDGITLANGDRVLVKNQTTASQNGIYSVNSSGSWSRLDGTFNMPGSMVTVLAGTVNSGRTYRTDFKSTDTVGVSAMNWYRIIDESISTGGGDAPKRANIAFARALTA